MDVVKGRFYTKYATLALLFTFCQVIGIMCVLPDISMAEQGAFLVEEHMVCPMDGTVMCPPSAVSSPERQVKHGAAATVDQAAIQLSSSNDLTIPFVQVFLSWSSAYSIVPISIGSSSVLRI